MYPFTTAATILIMLGFGSSAAPAADSPAIVGEVSVYKKVEGRELRLWVLQPAGKPTGERPAIVFFHGGGWTGGTPAQFNEQSNYLASRGMVCVNVEYRLLKGREGQPPTVCCHDAKSAMRWVRGHAKELGIDPARIAAGGGSAGGHLAAFVRMVDGLDDPADDAKVSAKAYALILFNPVFDNGPAGWGHARVGERYREFSPAHNISADDPPAIVFLGTEDKLIPVKTVTNFAVAMEKAGVKCQTHFYEGQAHGFFNKDPWRAKTLAEADMFLVSLGWLEALPTKPSSGSPASR